MIQQMLAIWSLVSLPFLKPGWTSGSSRFMYCWSLAWRILSITQDTRVQSLGREDLLEREMATHSGVLAWKIPWMVEPCRLQSMGSHTRVGQDWATSLHFTSMWDECNCVAVWAFFGIAFLCDWNESWPFPVLWPLLSIPNLLAYWVKHFHSIIIQDLK